MREPLVALVTGANRGIGLEVCRQLAARGLRTILTGRNAAAVRTAAAGLSAEGLRVECATLDVASRESIARASREIDRSYGGVDVLVNNAGILVDEGLDFFQTPIDEFRSAFETNVAGPVALCQAFVPGMVERRYGRVVNVSSGAGQLSSMSTYAPAYSVSKAALNAVTRQLAAAVRGTGVLANAADPGWVRTDMGGHSAPRSVAEGADTIVWLATLPASGPTGGFFSERQSIAW
ncbi:MAG TPA: SDR family oxidoreductase [Vicinamibacterales bacterium]|jgi:NAD(P)-dependent dehydrogenase (short-subunit alcohol dehydrogenase family)|nr:SDR family oxidoreductase [Vicinamibacterales bacterium]